MQRHQKSEEAMNDVDDIPVANIDLQVPLHVPGQCVCVCVCVCICMCAYLYVCLHACLTCRM